MRDTPRGSYAALNIPSRYDRGAHAGHTLDGWHAERRPWIALGLALIAFVCVVQSFVRHGVVDHSRYEVSRVR